MAIDKNPRQITRLRVEDQKKLEDLATEVTYNSSTNTFEIGTNLEVGGDLYLNTGMIIYNNPQNKGNSIDISNNETIYLNGKDSENDYVEFRVPAGSGIQIGLTDENTKKLFGNSLYGSGNIDLYVYTLKLSASFSGGMGYIYIDYQTSDNNNNVEVNSVTKFTTLTKATEGSIISCICSKESGDGVTVIGNNIRYENGVWYVYRNDSKYQYSYQGQVSNATITNCSQLKKRTI